MTGRAAGVVSGTRGAIVTARLPSVAVGSAVTIFTRGGTQLRARVAAIDAHHTMLIPSGSLAGVAGGDRVVADPAAGALVLGVPLLGRGVDAAGVPLDGRPAPRGTRVTPSETAEAPGRRCAVDTPFWTGVRAIDGPLTLGRGARIGVFGAPACGKSTLLDAVVAGSSADATVVALIGERGREAERWLARIGPRTTVICATGDRSPGERVAAAEAAVAHAEALRRRGLHVLLVVDSLARVAAAAREVALAAGEPVGRAGYPPSVFALLARLLERAGAFAAGSITLIATVLSDGPDAGDPVGEAARAALDGHIVLSPELAARGWFPAIDLPHSTSRTAGAVVTPAHGASARAVRAAVAWLAETREARGLGLDPAAHDPEYARVLAAEPALAAFLCQDAAPTAPAHMLTALAALTDRLTDGHLR